MSKKYEPEELKPADQSQKPKEVDVENIDLELMKTKTADLPGLLEYAHSIGGFAIVPTEQGVIKGHAMNAMKEQTEMHMGQIYEQMQVLAKQAQKLKKRAEISIEIYKAEMRFQPVIGKNYYLYEKKDESKMLSMISPEEWGKSSPYTFITKVKLLSDHTWDILDSDLI